MVFPRIPEILKGYQGVIRRSVREGVGADSIYASLRQSDIPVSRDDVRNFVRDARALGVNQEELRRAWARRDISRELYTAVDVTSRYNFSYTVGFPGVDLRTGVEGVFYQTVGSDEEVIGMENFDGVVDEASESLGESVTITGPGFIENMTRRNLS